jgi:hypothetical protein
MPTGIDMTNFPHTSAVDGRQVRVDNNINEDPESDPSALFDYSIKSAITRKAYKGWLETFFKHAGLQGTFQEQCIVFVQSAREDSKWFSKNLFSFLQRQRERFDAKQISGSTLRNYIKPIKLLCDLHDIEIKWKKYTRGLPSARRWGNDRAPTREELIQACKYPDRRIKGIVCTATSGGIRLGAWDYLRWGHIQYIQEKDVARMRVYAGEDEEYFTYISGEAYKELKEWMDFRKMSGENVTKDSWLMRQLWDVRRGHGGARGLGSVPEKLTSDGLKTLIETAICVQGLRPKLEPGKKRHEFLLLVP